MELVAAVYFFAPVCVSVALLVIAGIDRVRRRRRDDRMSCRRHVRMLLPTSVGLVELCCHCDAGQVVDGQWEFAPPVDADHSL